MTMSGAHRMGKKRNAQVIATEIEDTCLNLTATVAALEAYLKPGNLAAKGLDSAGAFFLDEDGSVRVERVVAVTAAGLGILGLISRSRKN